MLSVAVLVMGCLAWCLRCCLCRCCGRPVDDEDEEDASVVHARHFLYAHDVSGGRQLSTDECRGLESSTRRAATADPWSVRGLVARADARMDPTRERRRQHALRVQRTAADWRCRDSLVWGPRKTVLRTYMHWPPSASASASQRLLPRAVVVFCADIGNSVGRLSPLAARLGTEHIMLCGVDYEGHGESAGSERGLIRAWEDLPKTVMHFAQHVRRTFRGGALAGLPFFVAGEGLGGTVALLCSLMEPSFWDGMLLLGPAVAATTALQVHPHVLHYLRLIAKRVPTARVPSQAWVPPSLRSLLGLNTGFGLGAGLASCLTRRPFKNQEAVRDVRTRYRSEPVFGHPHALTAAAVQQARPTKEQVLLRQQLARGASTTAAILVAGGDVLRTGYWAGPLMAALPATPALMRLRAALFGLTTWLALVPLLLSLVYVYAVTALLRPCCPAWLVDRLLHGPSLLPTALLRRLGGGGGGGPGGAEAEARRAMPIATLFQLRMMLRKARSLTLFVATPFLVQHGGRDMVFRAAGSQALVDESQQLSADEKTFLLHREAWHDLLRDDDAPYVVELCCEWLDKRIDHTELAQSLD